MLQRSFFVNQKLIFFLFPIFLKKIIFYLTMITCFMYFTGMKTEHVDANAVFDRLLSGTGLQRDVQLAMVLDVTPQAVSQARKKQKIPEGWLVKIAMQQGLSMDWLLFGTLPAEQKTSATSLQTVPASKQDAVKKEQPTANTRISGTYQEQRIQKEPLLRPLHAHTFDERAARPEVDLLCVPLVAATLSAGVGSLETENDVLDFFAFRTQWLCRKGNPDKMVLMKVYGDSMEPQICHGDMALIDQSKQQIYAHTIYAVGVNEEIYIKQIETLPGHRMVLRSFNKQYDPIEVDLRGDMADSVRIIGKVVWWCREA